MPLPSYYLEVLLGGGMTCVAAMMMNGGGILQVLFESFSKGPRGFPYIFFIAGKVTTLEPVYGPTFVDHGIFVLGGTSRFLMVLLPLKWVCIPYLPQISLMLSQRPCVYGIAMWPLVLTSLVMGWAPAVPWLIAPSLTSLADLLSLSPPCPKPTWGIYNW